MLKRRTKKRIGKDGVRHSQYLTFVYIYDLTLVYVYRVHYFLRTDSTLNCTDRPPLVRETGKFEPSIKFTARRPM